MSGLSYESSGVNYDVLDAFKRACQKAAATTTVNLARHGLSEPKAIRGESAYLVETPNEFLAHVEEGLGTKILVADVMLKVSGKSFYRQIAIDDVATITNDLAACGALPLSIAMFAAVGNAEYLGHPQRATDLAEGFAEGCRMAGAVWSGGETQGLKGMVAETCILGGSALGRIAPKHHRIAGDVQAGDDIIFVASSGVQTNGLTLCRAIADKMPSGYLTPLPNGQTYGEALLAPSVIYVKLVAACQAANVKLHYAAHVTGHGWRKLMRLDAPFVYKITSIREPLPVFKFIAEKGPVDEREMYATYNMGVGYAVFVNPADTARVLSLAKDNGYDAWRAGSVESQGARKAVEIVPLKMVFEGDTLNVRG